MDIIKRLSDNRVGHPITWPRRLLHDATDEITRLRTLLDDAEKALKPFSDDAVGWADTTPDRRVPYDPNFNVGDLRTARKTLSAIKQYKEEKENG